MRDYFDLSPYRSILCLNGTLPELSFFQDTKLPLIAADGAANSLATLGLKPQMIIGDLDSVHDSIRQHNNVLHCPEQTTGDYQKSLAYMKQQDLLPTIVVGISDGYLDHILNNINIFLETDSVLYAPPLIGCVIRKHSEFSLPINCKLSLFGIPSARVSSHGLKWELNDHALQFPGSNSCFNRTAKPTIQVTIHEGSVLALIYTQAMNDAGGE